MELIEPDVRAHARQLVDAFARDGECEFNSAFAIPLPCTAFLRLMGLPTEELELFLELKDGIIRPHMQTNDPNEASEIRARTGKRIYAFFEKLIEERRATKAPLMKCRNYIYCDEVMKCRIYIYCVGIVARDPASNA